MINNRSARFDYEILETAEAGLMLTGDEVKSIRAGQMKLEGSYVKVLGGELWLVGATIGRYSKQGHADPYDPTRSRKLLVSRKELAYFAGKLEQKGLTLLPLRVYPLGRRLKLGFGLGRGKKQHDKRAAIKERDLKRQIRRGDE